MIVKDYIKTIHAFPVLKVEEELYLFRKLKKLEKIIHTMENAKDREITAMEITYVRNKIIKSNLRLVISIAQKINYSNRTEDVIDLVDEGNLGLMEAIDRYDPESGFKFSTYAFWWIKQKIKTAIITNRAQIKASIHIYNLAYRIKNYLLINGKDNMNYQEIADFLKLPVKKVKVAIPLLNKLIYLDDPLPDVSQDSDKKTYADTVTSFYNNIEDKEMEWIMDFINEFLNNNIFPALKKIEIEVLQDRYGLNPERRAMTLKEISQKNKFSAERVRQVEQQTLKKIREMNVSSVLKELLRYS